MPAAPSTPSARSTAQKPVHPAPAHFADALYDAISRIGTPACIGLDPVLETLPASIRSPRGKGAVGGADGIEAFCLGVLESVAGIVPAVKPQSACFERYGQSGLGALRRIIRAAHDLGLLVILDAKRGDIGPTAEHYAAAAFGPLPPAEPSLPSPSTADALTLNGYMGMDTVEPFLAHPGRGVFILVRTSNPGSDELQAQRLADGRTVAELVADQVATLGRTNENLGVRGLSRVGAVVGATKSSEAAALRQRMPDTPFLVPGYGAEGGTLDDLRAMLRTTASAADSGVLVNASRSVLYPEAPAAADYKQAVRTAAQRFADDLASLFR